MVRPSVFLSMKTLYLVPTPLGDPDDITLRALRILREAAAVAAPDAAAARTLLDHYEINAAIIDYGSVLSALERGDVALIGSSGTPGLGGAAHEIIKAAVERGVRVEPLPGASAEITALVLSGLPTDSFVYGGALPDDLASHASEQATLVFTAAAARPALERLIAAFGDRRVCVCAALTQPNEVVYRGSISAALREPLIDGAVVLVVAGAPPPVSETWDEARVRAALRARLAAGDPLKLAAKAVAADAGWDRRAVYALGVAEKEGGNPP